MNISVGSKKLCVFLLLLFNVVAVFAVKVSYIRDLPDYLAKLVAYNIYNDDCAYLKDRLVLLQGLEYYNFSGQLKNDGSIIVLDTLAESVQNIFAQLKKIKFPLEGISPYAGVHIKKILWWKKIVEDDNYNYTGAFCCRSIVGGNKKSLHALGAAIDINPLQNPAIIIDVKKKVVRQIIPKDGIFYLNRSQVRMNKPFRPGMIDKRVQQIFQANGFTIWGGTWDFPVDYHHFQLPRELAESLVATTKENAKILFKQHIENLGV